MDRIIIFGNSGSGKSTLSGKISSAKKIPHLDLDTLAWQATLPPTRKPLDESAREINTFMRSTDNWVIEGCYSDLLEIAVPHSTEIIFLNLPVDLCMQNAKNRPWEAHKYPSKKAQDENLAMLLSWITQYTSRDDTFSMAAHRKIYDEYTGKKRIVTRNIANI